MKKFLKKIKNIPSALRDKKRRKMFRKKMRRIKRRILNKKTLTRIFMGFMAVALIASYVLPYVLR